ncbi:MAG: PTS sugar transporter subunit IIA [Elusimicrobiota bacterium]
MIGILIITHGALGRELLNCAEGIVGRQEKVQVLGLEQKTGNRDAFEEKIGEALRSMDAPAGVLVLADMMGGSPCNAALRQCRGAKRHFELVTGVNLPMLVSALTNRPYLGLEALAQKLVEGAPRAAIRPLQRMKEAMRGNQ